MDPFTISTMVVKVAGICLSTAKTLYDIRNKYNDAPTTLAAICSETAIISASLSYLQTIVCQKQELVQTLDSRPELAHTLDAALIGCMVLFSCLEEETRNITATSSKTGALSWKGKVKVTWNHKRLQELLDGLRGQQLAINLLVQLVQVDSLGEIRQLLNQNRPVMTESIRKTKLLKESHPNINVPDSIYDSDDRLSIYSANVSTAGVSALEFEFDDLLVNSKVYRRVLASARAKASEKIENDNGVIEGDLIDLSDSQTIIAVQGKNTNQDLECLMISRDEESIINLPKTSPLHSPDDHDQAITMPNLEESARGDVRILNMPMMASKDSGATAAPIFEDAGSSSVDNRGHGVIQTVESNTNKDKRNKFGDYFLGECVGKGYNSKVKVGWKREGSSQVAVKLITKKSVQTGASLARIYREVAILRETSHLNVVGLYEMIETAKYIGIIFEYASGGELFDYISTLRHLQSEAASRLFAQIISGIGYLHRKGIAHRNLNLHNLLLDGNRNIIIAGFGSANTFNPEDELGEKTEYRLSDREFVIWAGLDKVQANGLRRGDLMQTKFRVPYFTAPEMFVQSNHSLYTSRKVDIWSCGVVLYAMLAGHEPFNDDPANPEGDNIGLLYRYMVTVPLTFPEFVPPHPRDLLRRIIVPDPLRRADLFEIARHSWLAQYTHVLGSIYSSYAGGSLIERARIDSKLVT